MMEKHSVTGEMDPVSFEDIADLGTIDGPCVSLFMPTHRAGPQTLQDPVRARNLVDRAAGELRRQAVAADVIDALLLPIRALVDDAAFWQHQADGLAIFSAPSRFVRFRVLVPFTEEMTVASSFRVRPLLPAVVGDEAFFVLALSQNSVRLFDATRSTIVEMAPIIGSMAETLADEDPERQLQYHSAGGEAQFHGHGAGGEVDKATLERFLRAVDRALVEQLGDSRQLVVLACVGYYLPIFQSVTRYPNLFDAVVEGNPEHRSPAELLEAAWPLVESHLASQRDPALARFGDAIGTGNVITLIDEIVLRAREGRIDTLFVTEGPALWGRVDPDQLAVTTVEHPSLDSEDLIGRAMLDTMHRGGAVRLVDPATIGAVAGALLRY